MTTKAQFIAEKLGLMAQFLGQHEKAKVNVPFMEFVRSLQSKPTAMVFLYIQLSVRPFATRGQIDEFVKPWLAEYGLKIEDFSEPDRRILRGYLLALSDVCC